jgi:uncharacterized protein (TIGR02246 family)
MSIRTATTALLLAALLQGCAGMTAGAIDSQIRALEQQQAKAAISRDRAALEQIFAPQFRIVNPAGAIAGKEELLALLTEGASPYQSATYETQHVSVYREVVVSTGLETVVPARGAQAGQPVQRRITHVWQRQGGQWRLTLRHATVVTP